MNRWLARLWSSRSRRASRRQRSAALRLGPLENRLAPAIITVTSSGDAIASDGLATLREAVTSINNQADVNGDVTVNRVGNYASTPGGTPDVINFSIPGQGVHTIAVSGTPEPTIVRPLTINGYAQASGATQAAANTLADADNAVLLIRLDGAGAGANADGLILGPGGGGGTIMGLDITDFSGHGIVLQSNGNSVAGDFIGVNPAGSAAEPNQGDGVLVSGTSNNAVGGATPDARNVISGNAGDGVHIVGTVASPASGNTVQGGFIGVNAAGTGSVGTKAGGAAGGRLSNTSRGSEGGVMPPDGMRVTPATGYPP
jgi:hypothetical protein